MGTPGVFLDRDGTIIEDVNYLSSLEEIRWLDGAKKAIRSLKDAGYSVVVVTNQSGVARGLFGENFVHKVHQRLNQDLTLANTHIDAFYYCPHHPEIGPEGYRKICSCRKPQPGLILRAAQEQGIDLERSYLIGDNVVDIRAALNVGVRPILVLTGKGLRARDELAQEAELSQQLKIAPSILHAVQWILKEDDG